MISTLRGKAGNVRVTLPVTEWPGFFLSYMLYLPSVIMEKLLLSGTFSGKARDGSGGEG